MGYYDNVYSSPEKHGLEIVGEMDLAEPDYSFDILVVWKEKRGQYWIGTDSGCSCPSPFEEVYDKNSLDGPYRKEDLRKRIDYLIKEQTDAQYNYGYPKAVLKKSASDILDRIK